MAEGIASKDVEREVADRLLRSFQLKLAEAKFLPPR
jgi:hypothetical protein